MERPDPTGDVGSTGEEKIVYPIEHMRQTAAAILTKADLAQQQHDIAYAKIKSEIEHDLLPELQKDVLDVLKRYSERVRASYDWQMNLASALFSAIDVMVGTDEEIGKTFKYKGFGEE